MTTYQQKPEFKKNWNPILKPAEIVESRLIEAVLNGTFPPNSYLPGERELSEILGVTRPTLREALQRLACDSWFEIHQGKPTRVRDYLTEGKLGVLSTLSEHPDHLPKNFILDLLNVRLAMAPTYTSLAVLNAPEKVVKVLDKRINDLESPNDFAQFDWYLQHEMTLLSENSVFVMILNSFEDLFLNFAPLYFSIPTACEHSLRYYDDLAQAAREKDDEGARNLTEEIMRESIHFWKQTQFL